jgi:23S rRNA (adenine2503-C2)-methyltransferase
MIERYGATLEDLERLLAELGAARYRAGQVHDGLWRQRLPLAELTALPADLRAELETRLALVLAPVTVVHGDAGTTTKWLWRVGGGAQVETVLMHTGLMHTRRRATVCVSSQAGCAMGCTFCATGQAGFERHLSTAEIVEQVVRAQHTSAPRVGNVVFMGMGEPLANLDAVEPALRRLHGDLGLSARHLTVSTVGIVPGIERLAAFELPVTLAVSLHAPDDALRDTIVPVNRRYPIADVLAAARRYAARTGRRVTIEYAAIAGVNDEPRHAASLARALRRFPGGVHVNVIPLNATAGYPGTAPARPRLAAFAGRLRAQGVNATVRRNRGVDIDAACGQLRAREPADLRESSA